MQPLKQRKTSTAPPPFTSLWYEPAMFGAFLVAAFVATMFPLAVTGSWIIPVLVGQYLAPVLDQSLPILGVVGAVVVTLAVWTRFGLDASEVPIDLLRTLRTVLGAVSLLLAFTSVGAVYVGVGDARRWPEVLIVLVLSWVLSLACRLALGSPGRQEEAHVARTSWHRARDRAARYGIKHGSERPTVPGIRIAIIAAAPALVWVCVLMIATAATWDPSDPWQLSALALLAVLPTVAFGGLSLSWIFAQDLSADPKYQSFPMIFLGVISAGVMAAATVPVILATTAPPRWQAFSYVAIALFVASVVIRTIPQARRKIKWVAMAEDETTIQALRHRRKLAKRLQKLAAAQR